MEAIQAFLKKYDQIPPKEKSMALLLAKERFLKIKQAVAKVSFQYWKPPIFNDDDDEDSSIPLRVIISELPLSVAITPDLPITNSLIMEDEQLNTISETEADEENESSVKDRNLTPMIFVLWLVFVLDRHAHTILDLENLNNLFLKFFNFNTWPLQEGRVISELQKLRNICVSFHDFFEYVGQV
ncbi:hypothetical protein Tco_0271115 [Tanacetum coccineum]